MRSSFVTAALCAAAGLASSTLCASDTTSVVTLYTTITATTVATVTSNHTSLAANDSMPTAVNNTKASSVDAWTWGTFANYSMAILSSFNGTTSAVPITGKLTNPLLDATITSTEDINITTTIAADTCTVGEYCAALGSYIDLTTVSNDNPVVTTPTSVVSQEQSSIDHVTTAVAAPVQGVQTTQTPTSTDDEIFSSITLTSLVTSTRTLTVTASSVVGIPLLTVSAVPLLSSSVVGGAMGPVTTSVVATSSLVPSSTEEVSTVTVTVTGCESQPVKGASIPKMLVSTGSRVGVPFPVAWLVSLLAKLTRGDETTFSCPENYVCITSYDFSSTTTVTVWPTTVAAPDAPSEPSIVDEIINILASPSLLDMFIQFIIDSCLKKSYGESKHTTSQVNSTATTGVSLTSSPPSTGAPLFERQTSPATGFLTNINNDLSSPQSAVTYAGDAPFPPLASHVVPSVTETHTSQATAQITTTIIVQHTVYTVINATALNTSVSTDQEFTNSSLPSPTAFISTGLDSVLTLDPYYIPTIAHTSIVHVTATITTEISSDTTGAGKATATNTNGADQKYQSTSAFVIFLFFICLLV